MYMFHRNAKLLRCYTGAPATFRCRFFFFVFFLFFFVFNGTGLITGTTNSFPAVDKGFGYKRLYVYTFEAFMNIITLATKKVRIINKISN